MGLIKIMIMEEYFSQKESLLKTASWRILVTLITGMVVFIYTEEIKEAGKMTITAAVILTISYYFHERLWAWLHSRKIKDANKK